MVVTRRRFLKGLFGATVALPFLESVRFSGAPKARAAVLPGPPVYTVFVRQGNGCAQQTGSEPERFWPRSLGTITTESLSGIDADRAVSILAPYADRLLLVAGTKYNFPGNGCGHSGGLNQCLTASRVIGEGEDSLSDGPSIDWFIAQQVNPTGVEPLTLMSGPQNAYIAHGLSYSGSGQLRGAQNNPFTVYQNLAGLSGATQEVLETIARPRRP